MVSKLVGLHNKGVLLSVTERRQRYDTGNIRGILSRTRKDFSLARKIKKQIRHSSRPKPRTQLHNPAVVFL